jgi:hypothetical protein
MVEEIWQELAKARYTEWDQGATMRRRHQPALKCVYTLRFFVRIKVATTSKRNVYATHNIPSSTTSIINGILNHGVFSFWCMRHYIAMWMPSDCQMMSY